MPDHFLFVDQQFESLTVLIAGQWNQTLMTRKAPDRIHLLRREPQSREWQISRYLDNRRDFDQPVALLPTAVLGSLARIVYAGEPSAGQAHVGECIRWWEWNRFLWTIGCSIGKVVPIVFVVHGSPAPAAQTALAGAVVTRLAQPPDDILQDLTRVSASWQLKAVVIDYVSSADRTHSHELLEWLQSEYNLFSRLEPVANAIDMAPGRTGAVSRPRLENIHTHDEETLQQRLNDSRLYLLYRIKPDNAAKALNDRPFGLTPETLVFDKITVKFWRCPPEARAASRPGPGATTLDFRKKADGS